MFGGKPTFGSSANTSFGTTGTSLFGQQKPAAGVFGQTAAPAQSSSLFGQKTTTNLFGSPSTTQSSSIFGSPQPANTSGSLFGQKPGLFGSTSTQQQSTTNAFGGTSSGGGGLFGSGTTTTGGGLFGAQSNAPSGTTIKFNPLVASDTMMKNGQVQNIQTKNFCITAMKEYESKSLEELRVEDYMANRKAPTTGSTTGGGGLFGSANAAAQPTSNIFGSSTSSPFGSTTATAGQGTSLFGQTTNQPQATSLFGQKPAASGGLFGGGQAVTNTFGAAPSTGTSLFGNTGATTQSTFGAAQPQQPSLFGGAATTTSTFGQPAQQAGGLFGQTTTPAFGQASAPATTSLFGGTSTAAPTGGGLFGKPAAAQSSFTFGSATGQAAAPATGGGLFGNTAAKPGGLFGSTTAQPSTGGLFGTQPAQPATTGGLFGSQTTQPATGGFFGTQPQQQMATAVVSNPATVSVTAPAIVLGSDVNETQVKMALIEAHLAASPYGDSPLLKLVSHNKNTEEKPDPTSAARQMRFLASKKAAADSSTLLNSSANGNNSSLNNSGAALKTTFLSSYAPIAGSKIRSPAVPAGRDLNYKSSGQVPTLGKGIRGTPTLNSSRNDRSMFNKTVDSAIDSALAGSSSILRGSSKKSNLKYLDLNVVSQVLSPTPARMRDPDELPATEGETENVNSPAIDPRLAVVNRDRDRQQQLPVPLLDLDGSAADDSQLQHDTSRAAATEPTSPSPTTPAPAGVSLSTPDYYCEPTIASMRNMVVDGKVIIPDGLTVGRATYGSVFWPGKVELRDIALDEIVVFRHKEVTVYPDDTKKAQLGDELNRPAEVTLERVWHVDKTSKLEIRDPLVLADIGWRDRLENATAKMGATFKDYRPATGSWVFRVEHFSKYGLPDDDDDEVVVPSGGLPPPALKTKMTSRPDDRQLQSKVQRARLDLSHGHEEDAVMAEPATGQELYDGAVEEGYRTVGLGGILAPAPVDGGKRSVRRMVADDVILDRCELSSDGSGGSGRQMMDGGGHREEDDQQVPPEKKPKMDMDMQQVYEESNRLMEQLMSKSTVVERPPPRCMPPVRQFNGGCKTSEIPGFGRSRLVDMACTRGRVSRVGFTAGGLHALSLQPHSNEVLVRRFDYPLDLNYEYIVDLLDHNIRLSQDIKRNHSISAKVRHCELEGQTVAARKKPTVGDHAELIDSFLATAMQSGEPDDVRVWLLCKALFPNNQEGRWRHDRTESVCEWLRELLKDTKPLAETGRGASVWAAMCVGKLPEAIDAAIAEGLTTLAELLAVFQVDPPATRQLFEQQLELWAKQGSLAFVNRPLLKVYLAMSGRVAVDRMREGKRETVSCMDGLDWKQSMGVHMWWLRGDAILEDYLETAMGQQNAMKPAVDQDDKLYYQLLLMACHRSHMVESVLDAAGERCASPLDSHLSWHLWSVLRSFGHNTMNPSSEQQMHRAYSEQLIAVSMPDLALFVLSHISNDQCRSHAMRDCLDRCIPFFSLDVISRHVDLPKSWIASAQYTAFKAMTPSSSGSPTLSHSLRLCSLALAAGDLSTAHHLLVSEVAPNAIVSEETELLTDLLEKFQPVADNIPCWGQRAQMYADYLQMKRLGDGPDELNTLAELLDAMELRLKLPLYDTPIQRLCVQTIAAHVSEAQIMLGRPVARGLPLSASQLRQLAAI